MDVDAVTASPYMGETYQPVLEVRKQVGCPTCIDQQQSVWMISKMMQSADGEYLFERVLHIAIMENKPITYVRSRSN